MKNICIIATNNRRILTVKNVTDIPRLLGENETIEGRWFYGGPEELHKFLDTYPDKVTYFLKAFSYWIDTKVKGYAEVQNRYGKLKGEMKKFSTILFKKIRGLAVRIAKQVKKILKPKRAMYDEAREFKKMCRRPTSKQMRQIKKECQCCILEY
jgi:hypothetical protein